MSDGPGADPHASARANLRDTIKWLATSLAAVGAAVIAGASINGLASLSGLALFLGALLGGVGLLAILFAISILLRLLTSDVFYFSQLMNNDNASKEIADEIDERAKDLLPPQVQSISELVNYRDQVVAQYMASPPGSPAYATAATSWTAVNAVIAPITSLGQFLALRNEFKRQQGKLFGLTILIILSLGGYALLAGGKSELSVELAPKILFKPGAGWMDVAASLAKTCGSDPLNGTLLQKKAFDGWVSIRLSEPGKCSGLELTIPGSIVTTVGPSP
ncbi:hypothetical protein GOL88_28815 [Sinorhizobium medicae]|nr:hypothetical protein [Sinorhizobium medicae]